MQIGAAFGVGERFAFGAAQTKSATPCCGKKSLQKRQIGWMGNPGAMYRRRPEGIHEFDDRMYAGANAELLTESKHSPEAWTELFHRQVAEPLLPQLGARLHIVLGDG